MSTQLRGWLVWQAALWECECERRVYAAGAWGRAAGNERRDGKVDWEGNPIETKEANDA